MPSVIIMKGTLTQFDEIKNDPTEHARLREGMARFGKEYKKHYNDYQPKTANEAAALLFDVFKVVLTGDYRGYHWNNGDPGRFYEIKLKNPTQTGPNIPFKVFDENGMELTNRKFQIKAHIDQKGNDPHMNVTLPIGDAVSYLDTFNKLAAVDYLDGSTNFLAAATLISRCK